MGTAFQGDEPAENVGLIPRTISYLFEKIDALKSTGSIVEVSVRFLENKNIKIHESHSGRIKLVGASDHQVVSPNDVLDKLAEGTRSRMTASTNMNIHSSRSHAIFTIIVDQTRNDPGGVTIKMLSKFHMVDLAGSERLSRTGARGDRAKEAISINSGLLALGNVINSLSERSKRASHIPYRDSKLTRLLQDSLGGNRSHLSDISFTVMIACISPSDRDMSETLSTLNYAIRAKNIKNKVSINRDVNLKRNAKLVLEIKELKAQLLERSEQLESYKRKCEYFEQKYVEGSKIELPVDQVSLERQNSVSIISSNITAQSQEIGQVPDQVELESETDESEGFDDSPNQHDTNEIKEQFLEVNTNIALKEELLKELEERQRKYDEMREHYEHQIESLNIKIEELVKKETEEIEFCKSTAGDQQEAENIRQSYHDKIKCLQDELKSIKAQQLSYHRQVIEKEQIDNKLKSLKTELQSLKQTRVSLTRSLRKEIAEAQKKQIEYFRKVKAFERESNKKDQKIQNLQNEKDKAQNVLKRKIEELQAIKRHKALNLPKPQTVANANIVNLKTENQVPDENEMAQRHTSFAQMDSPAISNETKSKWKIIEDQINSLLIKKETLMVMNQQIDKLVAERREVSHELSDQKKKLENCPKRDKIQKLEEKLLSIQQSIESDQKEIAEIEETAIELFKTCKRGEDVYMFRHIFDLDEIVSKNVQLKELEIQKKIRKKRTSRKAEELPVPIQLTDNLKVKCSLLQRRQTALPGDIIKSFDGTPFAHPQRANAELERRVTRNMLRGMADNQITEASCDNQVDNIPNINSQKENLPTKKRLLK
ncbi:Kinesin-like protein KIF21B [Thelohanellus kitauei]|uniref:Kinesin-like protein n=1 Tax=Thelohanellus kitauei TaxID=669202 RepID=A0A0C2MKC0_THEKT|nr:Kinesin-like protein KIF21B [Thelohanellus kitauei]